MIYGVETLEEGFEKVLRILLAMYPYGRSFPRFTPSHDQIGHVAHGWYMRCKRDAQAVVLLEQHSFAEEAASLRRSIVEHVVGLLWLADAGNSVADVLRRGNANAASKKQHAFETAGWTIPDPEDMASTIAQMDAGDARDQFLQFKARCETYGGAHYWADYVNESSHAHPCWESALPYIEVDAAAGRVLSPRAAAKPSPPQVGFCAVRLHDALYALNGMIQGQPQRARLESIWFEQVLPLIIESRKIRGLPIPDALLTTHLKSAP